ncbi:uncharacterized protein [Engystomops pustulosus]|uniref:uncharacterized protein n=1 Tax=Engystomops pustulosus TaxID=76066 RepID=UPI003AFA7DF4
MGDGLPDKVFNEDKEQGSKGKGKEDRPERSEKSSKSDRSIKSRTPARKCNMCLQVLPESYVKPICRPCIDEFMRSEKVSFMDELKSFIEDKVTASVASATQKDPPPKKPRLADISSSDEETYDSEGPSCSLADTEEQDSQDFSQRLDSRHLFQIDDPDNLLKAIRETLNIEEEVPCMSREDELFGGLRAKKQRVFPVNETLKGLITEEWKDPEKKILTSKSFKRRLVFDQEVSKVWDSVPKVDVQVTKVVKKTDLPFEDSAQLRDPMDRKSDALLKKAWETSMLSLKSNISATSVARTLYFWLNELESHIRESTPRASLLDSIPLLRSATAFLADASAEGVRFAAKEGALTNAARRALWLKQWGGDIRSKSKLCSIPFTGDFVFGPELDNILEKASDKKKGFPENKTSSRKPSFRPFKNPKGKEVSSLIQSGVVIPVPQDQEKSGFYSPLFLVKKPNGSNRLIINLKSLNNFITYRRFHMESVRSATQLIYTDHYMCTIDLRDAYYHIPIHHSSQKFLRFSVFSPEGSILHFQFRALPFGISSAPRVFTKVMVEVVAFLRLQRVSIVPYLDDLLIIGKNRSDLITARDFTMRKLSDLLRSATAFLADASAEGVRFAAKEGALTNAARRALWLKQWGGDIRSKSKLCSIPFTGDFVFGPELDNILEKASDKKKGSSRSGVDNQHPKIRSVSLHSQEVPRGNVELYSHDVLSPSGKSRRVKTPDPLLQEEDLHYNQRSNENPGSPHGLHFIRSLEPEPLSHSAKLDSPFLEPENLGIERENHHSILGKKRSAMVVGNKTSGERGCLALPSVSDHHDLCKQPRLGSSLPFALRPGTLDPFTCKETFKLSGTTSRLGSLKVQPSSSEESTCPYPNRQHHGGVLPKATRRYEVSSSFLPDSHHLFLGRREPTISFRNSPKRSFEYGGRLPQQESDFSQRMVLKSGNLQPVDRALGHSASRLIRHKGEFNVSSILLSGGKGAEGSTRRLQSSLDRTSLLRLSPYSLGRKGPQEDPYGPGKGNTYLPELAKKGLVPFADIPGHPTTSDIASKEGSSTSGSYLPSRPGEATIGGVDPESDFLRSQGLSRAVVTTLKASRKKVTFNIYHKIWKKFVSFCGDNPPSQLNPNIFQILDFLQKGLELGLSTSTLKVQVSALGAFFDFPLADHRWVKRFISASSRIRPQVLRRTPTWDLTLVLDALSRPPFEPLESSNIKNLTLKTTLLIAVTTAKRLGELQAISIREPYMHILPDCIVLTLDPGFVPKVVSDFHRNQEITLPSFYENPSSNDEASWHLLDGKNKGRKASKISIARWLKSAISTCYTLQGKEVPSNLKAHSTRAMSASWAERRGASLEQICKAATWASTSTFIKHYRLDLPSSQDLSFGRKVLQAVIPP